MPLPNYFNNGDLVDAGYNRKRRSEESEDYDDDLDKDVFRTNNVVKRLKDDLVESSYRQYVPPRKYKSGSSCTHCGQLIEVAKKCPDPPKEAVSEETLLKTPQIKIINNESEDEKPQLTLSKFSVYDKERHLCPFHGILLDTSVPLYFNGYVSAIDTNEDGSPGKRMGPITEWWIVGYGRDEAMIGFSTDAADYYLKEPHECYASFMNPLYDRVFLLNSVARVLLDAPNPSDVLYETLLEKLSKMEVPPERCSLNEHNLLEHAEFICKQLFDLDSTAGPEDVLVFDSCCIQTLIDKSGIDIGQKQAEKVLKARRRKFWPKSNCKIQSKATTTSLVGVLFEDFLPQQIDRSLSESRVANLIKPFVIKLTKLEHLGWSPETNKDWKPDENAHLKWSNDIILKNFIIKLNRLSNEEVDKYSMKRKSMRKPVITDSESDSEDIFISKHKKKSSPSNSSTCSSSDDESITSDSEGDNNVLKSKTLRRNAKLFLWLDRSLKETRKKTYYSAIDLGDCTLKVGYFITTFSSDRVAWVKSMWEDNRGEKKVHGQLLMFSNQTIIGIKGNKQELFLVEECKDIYMDDVKDIIDVTMIYAAKSAEHASNLLMEWNNLSADTDKNKFFCHKRYNPKYCRYEDLVEHKCGKLVECSNCDKLRSAAERETPCVYEDMWFDEDIGWYGTDKFCWRDEEFQAGSCVFLHPGTIMRIQIKSKENQNLSIFDENYDENKYPERYRYRKMSKIKNEEDDLAPEPFDIGYICRIYSTNKVIEDASDVRLTVKKFYRPHNTNLEEEDVRTADLNMLFWSEEEITVNLQKVEGKCYVAYRENIDIDLDAWTEEGPYRFYFKSAYDSRKKQFYTPPSSAMKIGQMGQPGQEQFKVFPSISRPLRTMDVFAGCGGLTEGFHQANVADCLWAIEKEPAAARAFRENFPNATVFTEDCNELLKASQRGEEKWDGQYLPRKGDVELLCGGPPCQGFSGMNRFKKGDWSVMNNSLVMTYLSYCDHFKPRFFVMENVRTFVSHKKNMFLKCTMAALVKMGYQATFAVLQSGRYGIPQSRTRLIVLAAAPGEILPSFPQPRHTFSTKSSMTSRIGDKTYCHDATWTSAPYRMLNVYDSISDLPAIEHGEHVKKIEYDGQPLTHFQRLIRRTGGRECEMLRDHVSKKMSPLNEMRVSFIPRTPGSDWRDLPNIRIKLCDGSMTDKLLYEYNDKKHGRSSTGQLRGVCKCAAIGSSDCKRSASRQNNTLIPWCLPHTGNRHNHWRGLYGRCHWNDFFHTVITNPCPMGKQGQVLHPEQNRVVSVRECARSQGFPDRFKFFGTINDKYRQVGNAVAPPLAKCIALEIKKSIEAIEKNELNS